MHKAIHSHEEIDELIVSYLSGQINEDSLLKLQEWSRESSENYAYIRQHFELWISSASNIKVFNKDAAYFRFHNRISSIPDKKDFFLQSFLRSHVIYKIAAIALIILLPFAGYWYGNKNLHSKFADVTIETPFGAHTKIYLPDGSLAWLNAGTKLKYSQSFGVVDRNIQLEGEGYFEVTTNKHIPFTINSNKLSLQVIGTKFNFRNYVDETETSVNLIEGSIALHSSLHNSEQFILKPNDYFILNKETGKVHISKNELTDEVIAWTRNELFFDEKPLSSICQILSRAYDVEIIVADSISQRLFYGTFYRDKQSVNDILSTIASTGKIKYKIQNDKYMIY